MDEKWQKIDYLEIGYQEKNEHQNGRNSDNDNIDSPVRDDLESDSSSSKPPGPARISYPDDRLTDDSSLGETDFEADNKHKDFILLD